MTTITEVADRYLDTLAGLDPAAAEAAGRTPQSRFADLSPDGFAARAELARATATAAADAASASSGRRPSSRRGSPARRPRR